MESSVLRLNGQFCAASGFRFISKKSSSSLKDLILYFLMIAAISMTYACGGGGDHETGQGASVRISEANITATSALNVAGTSDGKIIAVWAEEISSSHRLKFNIYIPGVGWGVAGPAGSGTGDEYYAKVAMNASGNAVMVWLRTDGVTNEILVSHYSTAGGWGTPHVLEGQAAGSNPDVTVDDNGNAIVMWYRYNASDSTATIMTARYTVLNGWETPQTVNVAGTMPLQGLAGNRSGNVMLIWTQNTSVPEQAGHEYNTWASEYVPGGTWSSPQTIGNDIFELDGISYYNPQSMPGHFCPAISVDEQGNALAFWLEVNSAGSSYGIHVNRFEKGGVWGGPQLLGTTPADMNGSRYQNSYSPITWGGTGSAYFSWIVCDYTDTQAYSQFVLARYDATGGWTTEDVFSAYPYYCMTPAAVEGKNGGIHLFWLQYDTNGTSLKLWTKIYTPQSGWRAPVEVDSGNNFFHDYKVVRDDAGNVEVIWVEYANGIFSVKAKRIN